MYFITAGKVGRETKKNFFPCSRAAWWKHTPTLTILSGSRFKPVTAIEEALPALLNGINLITTKGDPYSMSSYKFDLISPGMRKRFGIFAPRLGFHNPEVLHKNLRR